MADVQRVFIISARRPHQVPQMEGWFYASGLHPTWVVPHGEAQDYFDMGVSGLITAEGLVGARNVALRAAKDNGEPYCVQISDDLRRLQWYDGAVKEPITLARAINRLVAGLQSTEDAKLAGCSPTDNAYFVRKVWPAVALKHFVVGDLIVIDTTTPLEFDPHMTLKEDYDYTCQHLERYGVICRVDSVLASFQHRTNAGGAVAIRTPEEEERNIEYLLDKWGSKIKRNPRREHEVLLRW